jgi:hypothetical protein
MKVLVVPVPLISTLKARVEQPAHDLLVVGNVPVTVQPKNVGFAGAVFVGDDKCRMAHAPIIFEI